MQINAQTEEIRSKVAFFKPQNEDQRKRLEEVNQEVFHVDQLMKNIDLTLAKEEKERATLVEDF